MQLEKLSFFQRHILGYIQSKVRHTSACRIQRFVSRMRRKRSALAGCLHRANIGGIVVSSGHVGELVSAATAALMATKRGLAREDARRRAKESVTILRSCRILRPFSRAHVPDWPFLSQDAETDGVFVLCPGFDGGHHQSTEWPASSKARRTMTKPTRFRAVPSQGGINPRAGQGMGLFARAEVRRCAVRQRGVSFRVLPGRTSPARQPSARDTPTVPRGPGQELWALTEADSGVLARVLSTLRRRTATRNAVPYIFERHLLRCAAATRVQAAWRGHESRQSLLVPLASCLIVARAVVCLQRWWRYLAGLGARLRSCRRLWALASAVRDPVMYVELDVYATLAKGWLSEKRKGLVNLGQDTVQVTTVEEVKGQDSISSPAIRYCEKKDSPAGEIVQLSGQHLTQGAMSSRYQGLPLWASASVVPWISVSGDDDATPLSSLGALITAGVTAKRVIWPLQPPWAVDTEDYLEKAPSGHIFRAAEDPEEGVQDYSHTSDTRTRAHGPSSRVRNPPRLDSESPAGSSMFAGVDLSEALGNSDLVELTFASVEEARARALLVAMLTEAPGICRGRPIAQLMTFGMLCRAASGKHDEPASILPESLTGSEWGERRPVEAFSQGNAGRTVGTWHDRASHQLDGVANFEVGQE